MGKRPLLPFALLKVPRPWTELVNNAFSHHHSLCMWIEHVASVVLYRIVVHFAANRLQYALGSQTDERHRYTELRLHNCQ